MEFADFNRDGMTDMAFASEKGVLTVLYNQFSSPGPKSTNLCNDVGNTAKIASDDIFPTYGTFTTENQNVLMYDLGSLPDNIVFDGITDSIVKANNVNVPGRLRVADIDQDGFPDFAMTLNFRNETVASDIKTFTSSVILNNDNGDDDKRTFSAVKKSGNSY